ncbi:MAG TPA: hypothetical protein VLL77_08465 [Anaerolineales bacterium]|nr:hypothetical protein [Anaerolineales bacterium]
MKRLSALLAATALLLAACSGASTGETPSSDVEPAPTTTTPETGGETPLAGDQGGTMIAGMGPGISVADLLSATGDGPFLVNGYVFVSTDGSAIISDAIAESYPPQPAGAQVRIDGVDLMQLPLVEGPADSEITTASWTDQPIQLLGDLVDGVFVGNSLASS